MFEPTALALADGGSHYYAGSPSASRAFVFLPGSSGDPQAYVDMFRSIGGLPNVLVVGLDYCNATSVGSICGNYCQAADAGAGSASCQCLDRCYELVRQVRIYGSQTVQLPQAEQACPPGEEVVARLEKVFRKLGATQFLKCNGGPCDIAWDKLVVAGSSQGAGMSAFIGMRHRVRRVNQYSGTVDSVACTGTAERPAAWISTIPQTGATPATDYYGLLHTGDAWADEIDRAWAAIGMPGSMHDLDSAGAAFGNKNRTANLQACCAGGAPDQSCQHGCPSKNPVFSAYWRWASGLVE